MMGRVLIFFLFVAFNSAVAQDSLEAERTKSCVEEEFAFYAPEDFGYKRDSEYAQPLSFSIKIPRNPQGFYHNNVLFGFYYKNSERIFINTRVFGKDSLIFRKEKLGGTDASMILNKRFHQFYEDSVYNTIQDFVLEDRCNYLININRNVILLLNILPENLECYLITAQSFREI